MFNRRHHCRFCESSVCDNCSRKKARHPRYTKPQRICSKCLSDNSKSNYRDRTQSCATGLPPMMQYQVENSPEKQDPSQPEEPVQETDQAEVEIKGVANVQEQVEISDDENVQEEVEIKDDAIVYEEVEISDDEQVQRPSTPNFSGVHEEDKPADPIETPEEYKPAFPIQTPEEYKPAFPIQTPENDESEEEITEWANEETIIPIEEEEIVQTDDHAMQSGQFEDHTERTSPIEEEEVEEDDKHEMQTEKLKVVNQSLPKMIQLEEVTEQEKEEEKTEVKEELKVNLMVDIPLESVEVDVAQAGDSHNEVESNDTDTIITHENVALSAKLDKLNENVAQRQEELTQSFKEKSLADVEAQNQAYEISKMKHKLAEQINTITALEQSQRKLKDRTNADRPRPMEKQEGKCTCILF